MRGTHLAGAALVGVHNSRSHCTENVCYLPSQLQRRGISYAESKTECQPTKHCKLYSAEILDRTRDRKAHGLCPQAHRYGHRDSTMILVTYRHGLRASEVCDLKWHQIELDHGRMHVRRAKNGTPSVHPIRGDEIRALRKLQRENPTEAYVFITERGSTIGFHHLIQRLGKAARMPFSLHPHMLRHACGYKLANDGHDTRALQHYLGHKNIQHTVRYTELSPDRFRDFWRD
jgi:integrase